MVLNDIIEQAAGRQSRASDQGGNYHPQFIVLFKLLTVVLYICSLHLPICLLEFHEM